MKQFFVTILMLVAAVAGAKASTTTDETYRYLYLEAVRQQDLGNHVTAFELFRRCHDIRPQATETTFQLGLIYLATGQDSIGMRMVQDATEAEPHNAEYAETLAKLYFFKNQPDKAAAVYEQLSATYPDRSDYISVLISVYERQHDYQKMLSALNRYETLEGQSEDITLSKMQAYSFMDDQQGAYRELKGLVDAHPYDLSLQVMMGNWLVSNARKEEALEVFNNVLAQEKDNAEAQTSLMDLYRAEGLDHQADSMMYGMLINPRTEPRTRAMLLTDWIKGQQATGDDSLRTMQLLDKVLELPQATAEVASIRVAYLMLRHAPSDTIKAGWRKVLDITPEDVSARMGLIQLMWKDSIDEAVIAECKKAVEYLPDEPVLYYYLAIAQHMNNHEDEAMATMQRGAANITTQTNAEMAANIYASLGDMLQKKGLTDEAFAAYDSCLQYNPDNITALNNYAYYLSLQEKDLKRAEKMSYRTITAEANNSTFIDTYAWILYQQGRYEEARIYIDQALDQERKELAQYQDITTDASGDSIQSDTIIVTATKSYISGDILDHAGDIYYRLGMKQKAMDFWKEALLGEPENEVLIRKKIKKQKIL